MKMNSLKEARDAEYELQFYGASSNQISRVVEEQTQQIIVDSVDGLIKSCLRRHKKLTPSLEAEIQEEKHELVKIWIKRAKEPIENIKTLIQTELRIPPNILLPSDEIHKLQTTETIPELKEEIKAAETQLKLVKCKIYEREQELRALRNTARNVEELYDTYFKSVPKISTDSTVNCTQWFLHKLETKIKPNAELLKK